MSRQRKRKGRPISGWMILDKPAGIGSTECVSRIKRLYQASKAGHAGTLDPLASGMLPIALGEATKTVPYVMEGRKTYRFTVCWGAETDTDDLEGRITQTAESRPTPAEIRSALARFTGSISQVPPAYSAIKIDGERAYNLARDGEDVVIEPRQVDVFRLEMIAADDENHASFLCECGKGTYVRSLARDLGRALGCLGHVSALRRIGVGVFDEEDMIGLAELEGLQDNLAALDDLLLPTGTALEELPEIPVQMEQAARIRAGNPVLLRGRDSVTHAPDAICVRGNELVAIGSVEQGFFKPRRVFRTSLA